MLDERSNRSGISSEEASYLLEWLPESESAFLRFFGFNTLVTIVVYAVGGPEDPEGARPDEEMLTEALEAAHASCVRYENLFSRTIADSDIGRLNAACGQRVRIHPDTFRMLQAAKRFCAASGGVFDITIGAATTLWDFHQGIVPDADVLAEAATHVDWRALKLVEEGGECFAQLSDPQAKVDVGGIAKGWIADRLVEQLKETGVGAALVDLGGNVALLGQKPDGQPWKIGIRDPRTTLAEEAYLDVIALEGGSIATSGTYERCFADGDGSHHHILDVRTGRSMDVPWASASVVATDATHAEGFSTTMLSLDEEGARRMMSAHPEIEGVIFATDEGELVTLAR